MNETFQQEQNIRTAEEPERTFTQAEMDAIIGDRLNRERKKYADYEELRARAEQLSAAETALQGATEKVTALERELTALKNQQKVAEVRARVSRETGVPAELLSGEEEATCKQQAEAILKFAQPATYPDIRKSRAKRSSLPAGSDSMRELAHQMFGAK